MVGPAATFETCLPYGSRGSPRSGPGFARFLGLIVDAFHAGGQLERAVRGLLSSESMVGKAEEAGEEPLPPAAWTLGLLAAKI
jgi:hypothetical protein